MASNILNSGGTYIVVGGHISRLMQAMIFGGWASKRVVPVVAKPSQDDLNTLKDMLQRNEIKPHITERFSLQQVPEAIRHVEDGKARGKVVVVM